MWRWTLLRSLCTEVRVRVEREVLSSAQSALDAWQATGYKLGRVHTLVRTLLTVLSAFVALCALPQFICHYRGFPSVWNFSLVKVFC